MVETKTTHEPAASASRPGRWKGWILGLGAVILAGAAGLFWFFGGAPPSEVDLAATVSAVADTAEVTNAEASIGVEGTWTVDTSVGDFSVTGDTTATFAGFRVEEVLASIGSTTAVGRSPGVSGAIEIAGTTLESAEIVVDLTGIISDQARREDAIQRALGTGSNPEAVFTLTEPVDLGDDADSGNPVTLNAVGELTINGVTRTVEFPLEAQLVDDMILVTGSTDITFADYEVTAPSAPVVVSVEDHGTVEFQVWLSR